MGPISRTSQFDLTDPPRHGSEHSPLIPSSAHLVHDFDGAEDAVGITALSPDIYGVNCIQFSPLIDLRTDENAPKSVLVTKLPAGYLDRIATLNEGKAVAISDSRLGLI
ncbi:hypothetical protein N7516_010631 [Penicillium verrucosum]|uniref:uncharacterized protein n=1 Tax=Penicillium verrucosum TaxID=60171 RepID=UPI0025452D81|nr:uncharacterized protein N7516_010631 [Penicillium verrucosum]KAJ5922928.1 hypothetical protein N7516_010631 [Penicillium verrucosum]